MITGRTLPTEPVFTLPLAMIASLAACLAVLSARLPWYVLPVLAAIPVTAWLVPLPRQSLRVQIPVLAILTFAIAGLAVYLAWRIDGGVPI